MLLREMELPVCQANELVSIPNRLSLSFSLSSPNSQSHNADMGCAFVKNYHEGEADDQGESLLAEQTRLRSCAVPDRFPVFEALRWWCGTLLSTHWFSYYRHPQGPFVPEGDQVSWDGQRSGSPDIVTAFLMRVADWICVCGCLWKAD